MGGFVRAIVRRVFRRPDLADVLEQDVLSLNEFRLNINN